MDTSPMATVLVVDDEPTNRLMLISLLAPLGHRLVEASDGGEALTKARSEHPDLVITDIMMPAMDGYELVRQLRSDPAVARTPVIFYSSKYQSEEVRPFADAAGARFLRKPAAPEAVLQAVESMLGEPVIPVAAPLPETFGRQHVRLLTDKLSHKVNCLEGILALCPRLALEPNPWRLLEQFCHGAREIIGARIAVVAILSEDQSTMTHLCTSGLSEDLAGRINRSQVARLTKRLLEEGWPLRLERGQIETALHGLPPQLPAANSFLAVLLVTPKQAYGLLYLVDKLDEQEFSSETEQIALSLAAQLAVAYESTRRYDELQQHAVQLEREIGERKRAEQQLREYSERLQVLSEKLIEVQETERRHLARELHDEIGQVLTVVRMNLQGSRRHAGAEAQPRLQASLEAIDRALNQVRNLSLDLRPSILDDFGLQAALEWYVARQSAIETHLRSNLNDDRLPAAVETACFRIVQEAVTNVLRHAGSRHVWVEVERRGAELTLCIRDDGHGFDVAAARARAASGGSMGLLGMEERAHLLGGRLEIHAAPARGAEVRVWLPLTGP